MKKENYETCKYAESTGPMAVYVQPGCPCATLIKGVLVSSKQRCRQCKACKRKDG